MYFIGICVKQLLAPIISEFNMHFDSHVTTAVFNIYSTVHGFT